MKGSWMARKGDLNFVAYQRMLRLGKLNQYRGKHIGISNGKVITYAETEEDLCSKIDADLPDECLIQYVPKEGDQVSQPTVHFRRPKRVVMPD